MKDDREFSGFSKLLLEKHYKKPTDKSVDDIFARTADNFCYGDYELADRLKFAIANRWFNYSSPPLSNSVKGEWVIDEDATGWKTHKFETDQEIKAMPISCYVQSVPDTLDGQIAAATELSWLSVSGGGVGQSLDMRGITDKSPGAIPYTKTVDSNIMYYHQASTRRGSVAPYLDISHPDIVEFVGIRNPTGGDINRKALNVNIGVNITDDFIKAVDEGAIWTLRCPHTNSSQGEVDARELWQSIMETRFKTGEPYLHYIDESNRHLPQSIKDLGLSVKASNICCEIISYQDALHTTVCCLSSLNLEYYDEWKDTNLVEDLITFLDNIIEWFIEYAPVQLSKAVRSAKGSRDLGLGTLGWHYYLQKNDIAFESGGVGSASQITDQIYKTIKSRAVAQSQKLAILRGEPEYMKGSGMRNAQLLAIAPNANSAIIIESSPSVELNKANIYNHRTRVGSHIIKNKYLDLIIKDLAESEQIGWYDETWKEIMTAEGSIQGNAKFTEHQQKVYKTANETDMRYVIDQARIRQKYLCQSQSINLFFNEGVSRKYVNDVHRRAFSSDLSLPGVPMKTLYYCRATKQAKVENVSGTVARVKLHDYETQSTDSQESCLSCEG